MLLDRRRIKKWAKWVALLSGHHLRGELPVLGRRLRRSRFQRVRRLFVLKAEDRRQASDPEGEDRRLPGRLDANPSDTTALLAMATVYQQNDQLKIAAAFLENAIDVDPTHKDVYLRLANIYMNGTVCRTTRRR